MHRKMRLALAAAAAVAAGVASPAAAAASPAGAGSAAAADGGSGTSNNRCAREFDEAQRVDMESFRDYDLETWKAGHDDDAITVLAQGLWFQGRDRIAAVLHRHFEDREAVWTWTELTRAVDGCKTATILYDTTYRIPSRNFSQHALVSVVYTRKHGKWLSVIDQGTLLPAA
jgi:hypothetical protein